MLYYGIRYECLYEYHGLLLGPEVPPSPFAMFNVQYCFLPPAQNWPRHTHETLHRTCNDLEFVLATSGGCCANRSGWTSLIRGTILFLTPTPLFLLCWLQEEENPLSTPVKNTPPARHEKSVILASSAKGVSFHRRLLRRAFAPRIERSWTAIIQSSNRRDDYAIGNMALML